MTMVVVPLYTTSLGRTNMDLLEKIDLYIGEEVVTGGATPGTTTDKVAKYPEKFVVGQRKKKKKKFEDEIDKV